MKTSNKINGSRFETRIAQILSKHGFWVHLLAQNAAGQPADIIAVKNGKAYLIDCKLCEGNYFDLRRIELNQELSMTKWRECKNGEGLFCISFNNKIYMINLPDLLNADSSRITEFYCGLAGGTLESWLKYVDNRG